MSSKGNFVIIAHDNGVGRLLPLEMSASDYALGKVSFYAEHHGSCKVQKPFIPKKKSPDSILDYGILTYRISENFIYRVYVKCA